MGYDDSVQRRTAPYDALRRSTTPYDAVRRCTTPYDAARRRSTPNDAERGSLMLYDAVRGRGANATLAPLYPWYIAPTWVERAKHKLFEPVDLSDIHPFSSQRRFRQEMKCT